MIRFETGAYFSYDMIGEFRSSGEWIHPRRTIVSHELIFVREGMVYIAQEGREFVLRKDQLLLLEAGKEHYGYKTVCEPIAFYWFHFFTDITVPLTYYTGTDTYEIKQLLKKLLHITNTPAYSRAAADAAGYLILEELDRLFCADATPSHLLASELTEYVRMNIGKPLTVSDIARALGYNADYIGKLFKRIYGLGLKEYIAVQKLRLAKDLLLTTEMSVKQVSRALGYAQENLFIKFFLYHEKISPTAFKMRYRNTHINNQ